jgi:alkylated DNA repair dioxygenase AlkB
MNKMDYDNFEDWFNMNYPTSGVDTHWLYSLLIRYEKDHPTPIATPTQERYCTHMNVEQTACANTGNYDPHTDSYWYEFKCLDCKKTWSEDQTSYNNTQRATGWVWEKQRNIVKKSKSY